MAKTLEELLVQIDATTENMRRELAKGSDSVDKFQKKTQSSLDRIDSAFEKIGSGFDKFKVGLAAVGVGAAVYGLADLTKKSLDAGDAMLTNAQNAGMAAERYQSLRYAASQSQIEVEQYDDGMRRLNRRFGEFLNSGAGPAQAAFEKLGLAADINNGKISNSGQLFDAIISKMQAFPAPAQKAAFASQLFGDDAGPKFVALLSQTPGAIKALEDRAKSLGLVLSTSLLNGANEANDQLAELKQTLSTNLEGAILKNADAIKQLGQALTDAIPKLVTFVARVLEITGLADPSKDIGLITSRIDDLNKRIAKYQDLESRAKAVRAGGGTFMWGEFGIMAGRNELLAHNNVEDAMRQRAQLQARLAFLQGPPNQHAPAGPPAPAINWAAQIKAPTEIYNSTTFSGEMDSAQKQLDDAMSKYGQMQVELLQAQGNQKGAIVAAAQLQIDEWKKVAEKVPALGKIAADSITLINQKAVADIKHIIDPAAQQMKEFTNQLAANFESAFSAAIISGQSLGSVFKGLTQDIIKMVIQMAVIKPLAESLANAFGPKSDGKSSIVGGLFQGVSHIFGGGRAGGGGVSAGTAYIVGERRPEIFVPNVSGAIIPSLAMAGGRSIQVTNHNYFTTDVKNSVRAEIANAAPALAAATSQSVIDRLAAGGAARRVIG